MDRSQTFLFIALFPVGLLLGLIGGVAVSIKNQMYKRLWSRRNQCGESESKSYVKRTSSGSRQSSISKFPRG